MRAPWGMPSLSGDVSGHTFFGRVWQGSCLGPDAFPEVLLLVPTFAPPCHEGDAKSGFSPAPVIPGPGAGAAELFGAGQAHLHFAFTRASIPLL